MAKEKGKFVLKFGLCFCHHGIESLLSQKNFCERYSTMKSIDSVAKIKALGI